MLEDRFSIKNKKLITEIISKRKNGIHRLPDVNTTPTINFVYDQLNKKLKISYILRSDKSVTKHIVNIIESLNLKWKKEIVNDKVNIIVSF